MPNDPIPEFFRSDNPERMLGEVRRAFCELQKLYQDAEKANQEPEIQEAYKTIISHKGWLLSNLIIKMYQSMMSAVAELEEVQPYTKMAFSPYPFKS